MGPPIRASNSGLGRYDAVMDSPSEGAEPSVKASELFATTHWSVVLAAGQRDTPQAGQALEKLCQTYWYPLYAFARRQGHAPEDAQDLTQAFFERFLEKNYLKDVARERGRFRSFLLAALRHFLADQRDRTRAAKRGGRASFVPLFDDEADAEARYQGEPSRAEAVERSFDRAWAQTVMRSALRRLGAESAAAGKAAEFAALKPFLSRPPEGSEYDQVGEPFGLNARAIAMAVSRLRARYRELVRQRIADTVATPGEVEEEMRYLIDLLTG
jgi:RNA polymerase sigma-70 factor (ECF subfamily)